jgi:hypothetical protein
MILMPAALHQPENNEKRPVEKAKSKKPVGS